MLSYSVDVERTGKISLCARWASPADDWVKKLAFPKECLEMDELAIFHFQYMLEYAISHVHENRTS